jgi:hypothetical protein
MADQIKEYAQRWRFGAPFRLSEKQTLNHVVDRLVNLERILEILHPLIEYPRGSVEARITATPATAITTTTATDINGAAITITPEADCSVVVSATFVIACTLFGALSHVFAGALEVDGVAEISLAVSSASGVGDRRSVRQEWVLTGLKAGTSYTLNLAGYTSNVATQFSVEATHTGFVAATFPDVYEGS